MKKKIAKVEVEYGSKDGYYQEIKSMNIHDEDRMEHLIDKGLTLSPLREAMNEAMENPGKKIVKRT